MSLSGSYLECLRSVNKHIASASLAKPAYTLPDSFYANSYSLKIQNSHSILQLFNPAFGIHDKCGTI